MRHFAARVAVAIAIIPIIAASLAGCGKQHKGGTGGDGKAARTSEKTPNSKVATFDGRTIIEWHILLQKADDAEKDKLRDNAGLNQFVLQHIQHSMDRKYDGEFSAACELAVELKISQAVPHLLDRVGFRLEYPVGDKVPVYSL